MNRLTLLKKYSLLSRVCYTASTRQRCPIHTDSMLSQKKEDLDDPVKFSETAAKNWQAHKSFTSTHRDRPWYQPYSVVISFSVFLIYFCFLREENDVDEALGTSLYSRIPGLEESQIIQSIDYNRQHGKSTEALEARLKELRGQ